MDFVNQQREEKLHAAWAHARGFLASSMSDWPGRISAVLFLGGCNFKCPTCHNAELAWNWRGLPALGREEVLSQLSRKARWLDGITVTGGEPTCTPGIKSLLFDLTGIGLPIKLDSNGSRPDALRTLLAHDVVQTVAVDVKGPWRLYPELTGGSMTAEKAEDSLRAIFGIARDYPGRVYFRCTKVPLLSERNLAETAEQLPAGQSVIFQNYVPPKQG